MANGEVLEQLADNLDILLKNKKLSPTTRSQLEIQQLFLIYLRDSHKKVNIMWSVFKPMAWAMTIAATSIIGLAATGHISISFR